MKASLKDHTPEQLRIEIAYYNRQADRFVKSKDRLRRALASVRSREAELLRRGLPRWSVRLDRLDGSQS